MPAGIDVSTPHQPIADGDRILSVGEVHDMHRDDELALWLPHHRALVFGDAMIRTPEGELRLCPEDWTQPPGGRDGLRAIIAALTALPVEHVLVSHGPGVLGDGASALRAALT